MIAIHTQILSEKYLFLELQYDQVPVEITGYISRLDIESRQRKKIFV